jgi:hypothetical protein
MRRTWAAVISVARAWPRGLHFSPRRPPRVIFEAFLFRSLASFPPAPFFRRRTKGVCFVHAKNGTGTVSCPPPQKNPGFRCKLIVRSYLPLSRPLILFPKMFDAVYYVLQKKKTFSEPINVYRHEGAEHTFSPYGPMASASSRGVGRPDKKETMTGCQTVHRTRKHNQSVLLHIPIPCATSLHAQSHRHAARPPARRCRVPAAAQAIPRVPSPQALALPRHLSTRLARDEVHVAFLSPLFARLPPLCSAPLLRSPGRGRVLLLLLPCLLRRASASLPFARLLLFFTTRKAWRFGSAWRPAASTAA